MLRRLFIALLALCLSVPALAMPGLGRVGHPQAAPAAVHGCHDAPAGDHRQQPDMSQGHQCIGCAASYAAVPVLAPVAPLTCVPNADRLTRQDALPGNEPDTPPPRF